MDRFRITAKIPTNIKTLFDGWLNAKEHEAFTGGKAKIENKINGKFTAWDEYISGRTIEISPYKKIVQKWRTVEFPDDCQDSTLEILFEEVNENETKITLSHHHIPKGQGKNYKKGWKDHYFDPMKEYYGNTTM